MRSPLAKLSFNSTMVRLKVMCQRRGWVLSYKFQFHNGSIKSVNVTFGRSALVVFQFHNGSIKSAKPQLDNETRDRVSIPQWFD